MCLKPSKNSNFKRNLDKNYKVWEQHDFFALFTVGVTENDEQIQFVYNFLQIFNSLEFENNDKKNKIQDMKNKFQEYCELKKI